MISAPECRAYSARYEKLAKAADISIQRATALLAIANSWARLADQTESLVLLIREETKTLDLPKLQCPKCGIAMQFTFVEPAATHHQKQIFNCVVCWHSETVLSDTGEPTATTVRTGP